MTRLFLIALLASLPMQGAATLKGQLIRNEIGGPPIAGAEVGADGANPTVSTALGGFTLVFPEKKPGERVKVTVSMAGMVVVNWVQFDALLPADAGANVLTLVLAREAEREEMARRYFRLRSLEVIEANYKRLLGEAGQDRARLARELEQAKAAAGRAAEDLAKVRPGEASALYEQAMRLYLSGKVKEAIAALDDAKLREMSQAAEARVAELTRSWRLRGQLLTTQFRFAEAEGAYAAAVALSPGDYGACWDHAYFLANLNRHAAATATYTRCLSLARASGDPARIARTLNGLGVLHSEQNRVEDAQRAYDEALAIRRQLANANPDAYRPSVADTLTNLGNLYNVQNRMEEARQAYEAALSIRRQYARVNPADLAATLNNLGVLHHAQKRMDEARREHEEALVVYRRLASTNRDRYLPLVAMTLSNLGNVHRDHNQGDEALKAYTAALATYRQLISTNGDTYLPSFAKTLNNLGILYRGQDRMDESRRALGEALDTFRGLARTEPNLYLPFVAMVRSDMGRMYAAMGQVADARRALTDALEIYQKFATHDAAQFQPYVDGVKADLAKMKP